MHPQVRLADPNAKCPICGMALIPVANEMSNESGSNYSSNNDRLITLSSQAVALLDIEVTPVVRAPAILNIDIVGKIDYDETRLTYITAWFGGRLDRLFVDYTGTPVRKGDHLAEIYSPEVFTAQEELIQALRIQKNMPKSTNLQVKRTNELLLNAARDKLRLWGLSAVQIKQIENRGTASERVTLHALNSGVVVDKNANQGSYVETGTRIYTIADLSQVWLNLSAYESDLAWLRYGQKVNFNVQALPGHEFSGTIAFISPVLNESSRTVQVRVNVPNTNRTLKPGMLASAVVKATTSGIGRVIEPNLADKYICPMHPEEVSKEPGNCSICGMPLVQAHSLGYVSVREFENTLPLLIPRSAVLLTGRRAVVYIKVPNRTKPTFEGREIVLGPRADEQYIVESGLQEGDLVVTSGNFSIDSALQIQAKPSMMSPTGGGALPGHGGMNHGDMQMDHSNMNMDPHSRDTLNQKDIKPHHSNKNVNIIQYSSSESTFSGKQIIKITSNNESLNNALEQLLGSYLNTTKALADDNFDQAIQNINSTQNKLSNLIQITSIQLSKMNDSNSKVSLKDFQKTLINMHKLSNTMTKSSDIKILRDHFAIFSDQIIELIQPSAKLVRNSNLYIAFCPMALDFKGAYWLQKSKGIRNPYFGESMLTCGEIKSIHLEEQEVGQ
ncbi:efflux RND transporter periplasmic adaptor subunit [Planctomycetota bacterium]|nr:efflux RND transporter periplasmic adaptor subunit [Planctomycetota bacterium]